jgi:hypothetical protein
MSTINVEADHDAVAVQAAPMPRPDPEHRSMTGLKDGVLNVYTCVMNPCSRRPIRAFSVSTVKPEAQYDQSVTITFTYPRKRKSLAMGFYPTNGQYATVEVDGTVVYDSRADIPCDMDLFNSSRARFDSTFNEPTTTNEPEDKDTTPMVMTKTEIATQDEPIEGEVVEPLGKRAAKALDTKIRAASERISRAIDKVQTDYLALAELIDEARRGQIYQALEYSSWTAWVKDAVQIIVTDKVERKELVALMSDKGMSTRAIAGTLNVSKSQVARDAAAAAPNGAPEDELAKARKSKGLDGKNYPASRIPPKKKPVKVPEHLEPEPLDVDEVPPTPADDPLEPKAPSNAQDWRDEVYKLQLCVSSFRDIIYEDERFDRSHISGLKITQEFRTCLNELDELLDVIDGDD